MSRRVRSDLERAAPLFSALGDPTRLAVVARLSARGPQSISQLTADSSVTRQAITRHLDVLAAAGLVHDVRRGRERIWDLETERLAEAGQFLDEISKQWDDALARLTRLVEE